MYTTLSHIQTRSLCGNLFCVTVYFLIEIQIIFDCKLTSCLLRCTVRFGGGDRCAVHGDGGADESLPCGPGVSRTDACDERGERTRPVLAAQGPRLLPTARLRQPDDHGEDC